LYREVFDRHAIDVDRAHRFGVLRLECVSQPGDAGADFVLEIRWHPGVVLELSGKRFSPRCFTASSRLPTLRWRYATRASRCASSGASASSAAIHPV
jgi:hypothetical protein